MQHPPWLSAPVSTSNPRHRQSYMALTLTLTLRIDAQNNCSNLNPYPTRVERPHNSKRSLTLIPILTLGVQLKVLYRCSTELLSFLSLLLLFVFVASILGTHNTCHRGFVVLLHVPSYMHVLGCLCLCPCPSCRVFPSQAFNPCVMSIHTAHPLSIYAHVRPGPPKVCMYSVQSTRTNPAPPSTPLGMRFWWYGRQGQHRM